MHLSGSRIRFLLLGLALSTAGSFAEQPTLISDQHYPDFPASYSAPMLLSAAEYRTSSIFDSGNKLNYPKEPESTLASNHDCSAQTPKASH